MLYYNREQRMKDLLNKMKKLNENKNAQVITFDFDNTIVKSFENNIDGQRVQYQFGGINPQIVERIKKFKQQGATVLIVTARNVASELPQSSVRSMLDQLNIKVDGVFYTNGRPKAQKLYELGSSLHYDDDPKEKEAIEAYGQLHKDFNIKVIDANSLLSDGEEVSKGLLLTTDNKIIIVQRSDSLEWDAAGGHLMEGELPEFALWREIKEEMQLDISNVQHLDSLDTSWKKKTQRVHYFIASVPHSCEELDGAVELQWELEDYFCGDIRDIENKMADGDGATENLRNVIDLLLQNQDLLMESLDYQKVSKRLKKYPEDASEFLDTGPQTRGSPYKDVDLKKQSYKSAPPGAPGGGWGPIGEEKGGKKRSKLKIRFVYDLEEKKKRKKRRKGKKPGPKKGSKRKKIANKYHWGVGSWDYGGGYGSSGDGGGDGGGGE